MHSKFHRQWWYLKTPRFIKLLHAVQRSVCTLLQEFGRQSEAEKENQQLASAARDRSVTVLKKGKYITIQRTHGY